MALSHTHDTEGEVVIVSNRGPHDFVWHNDAWVSKPAAGGLVSMLEPLARRPNVDWYCCVSEPPGATDSRDALYTTAADQVDPELHVIPVPVPSDVYRAYYGLISNEVLWMLQHHLVGQFGYERLDQQRHHAWSHGYLEANRRLADAIAQSTQPIRAFLIQDYHLYPLPAMLRERFPDVPSLHFTHIPFPDARTLKLIPESWRRTILSGMLGADVVGMQTPSDVRHFVLACEELLGAEADLASSTVRAPDGREVRVRDFPAATDPNAIRAIMKSPSVKAARARLAPPAGIEATIIRVDRLDPSKNQITGFLAFGRLLEMRPDLRAKARFLAFLVPSRTDLGVYRAYRDQVYKTIDEINNRFALGPNPPIQVFYTNDREQALAAMADCDVLLANSREDGMNLVVKEWAVVSQRPGVVIVSETAGVAHACQGSALQVCAPDVEGTALALAQAIDMPRSQRVQRLARFRAHVEQWTAARWLSAQMDALGVSIPATIPA